MNYYVQIDVINQTYGYDKTYLQQCHQIGSGLEVTEDQVDGTYQETCLNDYIKYQWHLEAETGQQQYE